MSALGELGSLRGKKSAGQKKDNLAGYLFLAPWLLGLFLITIGPMLASLYLSFTDYNLIQAPKWIGLDNFARMLSDERLHNSLRVTFTYVFVSVPLQLAIALLLAVVLDRGVRGLAVLPVDLLPAVAARLECRDRDPLAAGVRRDGLLNQLLDLFGIEGQGWISDPSTALGTLDRTERVDVRLADGDLPGRTEADPVDVLRGRVRRRCRHAGAGSSASRCRC